MQPDVVFLYDYNYNDTGFIHLAAAVNIDTLFSKGILGRVKSDREQDRNIDGVARIFTPITFSKRLYMTQTTLKLLGPGQGGNNIYRCVRQSANYGEVFCRYKKGNASPITVADADLSHTKLKPCRSLGVSRIMILADNIFNTMLKRLLHI